MALKIWMAGEQLIASDLNNNFSETARTALTLIPRSAINDDGSAPQSNSLSSNTTARVGQVIIPFKMTVNKISIRVNTVTVAGTLDLTLYSEDGQTQLFSVTTPTVSANTIVTVSVPGVVLLPGVYYIMINPNGTANVSSYFYGVQNVPFSNTTGLVSNITSEPVMQGTLTIAADTPPTTFTPSSITGAIYSTIVFRLDN